ncbi:MAG: helix-turn-helix domain-containing protein [Dehalococcoidia bacterium]
MSGQGLTVAEAAKALGLSERTIRRQIKSGKIKADLVLGRYGEEYRIDPDEVAAPGERVDKDLSKALDGSLDKTMDSALDKTLDMVKSLQQEKAELYAQVAYWQSQCRHMEEQVKLLMEAKQPWWQRWLGRG